MDGNRESILDELNDFDKRTSDISPVLEDYISKIAKTGDPMFPWTKLKPVLRKKLEFVLDDFYETCPTISLPPLPNVETFKYEILKNKILEAFDAFHSAPFTIQRICELLSTPRKHYKRTDKFMRGLEKTVLVVSTVEPKIFLDNEVNNNNAAGVMNGLIPPINNDQICKETSIMPSTVKPRNSDSQFDNFGMVSPSSSVIITDMSGTSLKEKIETSESIRSPDSPDKDNASDSNVSEMDVSSYKENISPHLGKINSDNANTDSQNNDTSSHDLITISNNGNSQTLENFTIFSSPSSPENVSEITGVPSSKKREITETEKTFNCNNEQEIDLSTFQENCDAHLNESAMDIVPAVTKESYVEESHISSPTHTSTPNGQDFFQDLCCPQSGEDRSSTVFSRDSPEKFSQQSHKTEIRDSPLPVSCVTEKIVVSDCNSSGDFHDEKKDVNEKGISSHTMNSYEVCNDEASEKELFPSNAVSPISSSHQDPIAAVLSNTEADTDCSLTDSPNVTSVQDNMDLESANEQITLSQASKVLKCTSESDEVEMEQD